MLSLALLVAWATVPAYERDTHYDLSKAAVYTSQLRKDATVLENLGIQALAAKQTFRDSTGLPKTISELIRDGSRFEDGLNSQGEDNCDSRVRHHFFDPVYERGLTIGNISLFAYPSPDWALKDTQDIGDQKYSL